MPEAEGVCTDDFLNSLSKPPWTKPLNRSLHITCNGDERTPFYVFVESEADQTQSLPQNASFSNFNNLPIEIQIHILTFCSAPTLWQIMRSAILHTEAAKLFWADPDIYYFIEGCWLLNGGFSGDTYHDLSFMTHVQNVEIQYTRDFENQIGVVSYDDSGHVRSMRIRHGRVAEFWNTLQKRFPCAKKVVFNQIEATDVVLFPHYPRVSKQMEILLETCPAEVDSSALNRVRSKRGSWATEIFWVKSPHQFVTGNESRCATTQCAKRKTVLMPPKQFRGFIGEFVRPTYKRYNIQLQRYGFRALTVEALDRHHFDKEIPEPFPCPEPQCGMYLDKAGQWIQHVAEKHINMLCRRDYLDILPSALKHEFKERMRNLELRENEVDGELEKIWRDWHTKGIDRKCEIERGWIDRLENDEAWKVGVEARESELWEDFKSFVELSWCDPSNFIAVAG